MEFGKSKRTSRLPDMQTDNTRSTEPIYSQAVSAASRREGYGREKVQGVHVFLFIHRLSAMKRNGIVGVERLWAMAKTQFIRNKFRESYPSGIGYLLTLTGMFTFTSSSYASPSLCNTTNDTARKVLVVVEIQGVRRFEIIWRWTDVVEALKKQPQQEPPQSSQP